MNGDIYMQEIDPTPEPLVVVPEGYPGVVIQDELKKSIIC